MANKVRRSKGSVLWLSWADLRHEWILTLCLITAITAVLSPLFILFGLKYGLIAIYTHYMTQNPVNREMRPLSSRSYDKAWFEEISQRPEVAFIIPNTRQLSATIIAHVKDKEKKEELELIPTAEGDPLILENGTQVPHSGECVLTQYAAGALEAKIGDTLVATASRIVKGKYEYGSIELRVAGILPLRASVRKLMYVQLDILEAVERFKDGQAVPELGWSGDIPKAYPQYDGLVVITPQGLDEVQKRELLIGTGFTKFEELNNDTLLSKTGFQVFPEMGIYFLFTVRKSVGEDSIKNVKRKLSGKKAFVFPYVSPIMARLVDSSQKEIASLNLYALSVDPKKVEEMGISPVPPWGESQTSTQEILKIMLPPDLSIGEENLFLNVIKEDKFLMFPVSVVSERSPISGMAFIPTELAGILRLYQSRDLHYDENHKEFVLARRGYASFRMYARTIYDVDGLRQFFEKQSLPVQSAAEEIRKVVELTTYLDLVFWLIATVGISGTVASLIASLYASVERKKRELGVLRLIGLSGAALFRFPIYQGILLGIGGFLLAITLFEIFSMLINSLFKPHVERLLGFSLSTLNVQQNLCQIPIPYILGAWIGTILIAGCAAMTAAFRVNRIEPAEALRDE
jgi:putative ABC transport system permease protein